MTASRFIRTLLVGQGVFYLLTGVWPLLHMPSFLAVTGPKTDLWLVRTVGVLIGLIATVLLVAGARRRLSLELWLLAVLPALGLGTIDVVSVAVGRIPPVYLIDAAVEALLVGAWLVVAQRHQSALFPPAVAADRLRR